MYYIVSLFKVMNDMETGSEAGSSQDLPPSANQPARSEPADEVPPAAMVEPDLMCEWMHTMAQRMNALESQRAPQMSPVQTPIKKKRARVETYDLPPSLDR